MKYVPPIGGGADDPYVNANPAGGIEGSAVPAEALEHPMRELAALIADAGLVPSEANLSQVAAAVRVLIQRQPSAFCVAAGAADAMTGAFSPAITEITHGMRVFVRALGANTIVTPTFKADGTGALTIVKGANAALAIGDIAGAGYWMQLQADATLNKWVLLNPATGVNAGLTQAAADLRYVQLSAFNGSNQSLATSGYQKISGGLILQWGTSASIAPGVESTVTLPIAFPNETLNVQVQRNDSIATQTANAISAIVVSASQIKIRNGTSSTLSPMWFAIGR